MLYYWPAKMLFFQPQLIFAINPTWYEWQSSSSFPSNQSILFVTIFFLPHQAWSFLSHLPVIEVKMSLKGWWEESQKQTERCLPAAGASLREESSWLDVHADQEYVLQVSLRRINLGQQRVSMSDTNTQLSIKGLKCVILNSRDIIQLHLKVCEACLFLHKCDPKQNLIFLMS